MRLLMNNTLQQSHGIFGKAATSCRSGCKVLIFNEKHNMPLRRFQCNIIGIRTKTSLSSITAKTTSRPVVARFLNPWVNLANISDDTVLSNKVECVTRTFGVVAALMCSLSAAAIAVVPSSDEVAGVEEQVRKRKKNEKKEENSDKGLIQHVVYTDHVAGTSLLVSWGIPGQMLHDIYMACCAGSFYSSVCAMGLSAVLNAWLSATPAGATSYFVRYHSLIICSIPGFLSISTGLAGVALFIGLDRSTGTPVSYIGLGGTLFSGALVGVTTLRGMVCTYRLLTPLVLKLR